MEKERKEKICEILKRKRSDALLTVNPENIFYLTGFTGKEGALFITNNKGFLLVDSRYFTQAKREVFQYKIKKHEGGIKGIPQLIKKLNIKKIGFESQYLSFEDYRYLNKRVPQINLIPLKKEFQKIRIIKNQSELQSIKKAVEIASESFKELVKKVVPNIREKETAFKLEYLIRKRGSEELPFNPIVVSGIRSSLPHGVASDKKIKKGDLITIDFGARYKGYCSDKTRVLAISKPSLKQREVYQLVKDAHDIAISLIKPGIKASKIDASARDYIKKAGFGRYFGHALGHGVGLAVHENPYITPRSGEVLEEGNIITIEPGIYLPEWGGVRLEDMVLVTQNGCELLTSLSDRIWVI